MTDLIETAFDVAFQNPLWGVSLAQYFETLFNSVRRGAFGSEAIGVTIAQRFRNRFQPLQVYCLLGTVDHGRNAECASFSIGLGDIHPPQGQRSIPPMSQRVDGFEFGRRSQPLNVVHPCGAFALVFRHPFHGQGFAAKRVGQQPLQGFDLAPAAFPCGLHDTGLQPFDPPTALVPVNLVPVLWLAGGCTRGLLRVHLRFPPAKVLPAFS
jgi:hypothetical protein